MYDHNNINSAYNLKTLNFKNHSQNSYAANMKKFFSAILVLITTNCFAQQWIDYKLDSVLSVSIPSNFRVVDTLGQKVTACHIEHAIIIITETINKEETGVNIKNEENLDHYYKGLQKGFVESSKDGQLIDSKIINISGLKLLSFSLFATLHNQKQIRYCEAIFVNNKTFMINFWEFQPQTNEAESEKDKLFSSLKFSKELTISNQMNYAVENTASYKFGYLIGSLIGYVFIIGLIIFLIVWGVRKVTSKK